MIHKSHINRLDILEYWRNPSKEEIRFGYGAIHYRDFNFEDCFDPNGFLKVKVKSIDDNLIYYCASVEFSKARKASLSII